MDAHRVTELGGTLLARESRAGTRQGPRAPRRSGSATGMEGTIFHPEADRAGVLRLDRRPEHSSARHRDVRASSIYERMMRTLG